MRRALELALEQGRGRDAAVIYANLSIELFQYDGPQAALDTCLEGKEFSERRGIAGSRKIACGRERSYLLDLGRVDEALEQAREAATHAEAAGAVPELIETRSVELRVLAEGGRLDEDARKAADALIAAAQSAGEPQQLASALAVGARVYADQPERAKALLVELERIPGVRGEQVYATQLAELVRRAISLGDRQLAARLIDGVEDRIPLFAHALCACRDSSPRRPATMPRPPPGMPRPSSAGTSSGAYQSSVTRDSASAGPPSGRRRPSGGRAQRSSGAVLSLGYQAAMAQTEVDERSRVRGLDGVQCGESREARASLVRRTHCRQRLCLERHVRAERVSLDDPSAVHRE